MFSEAEVAQLESEVQAALAIASLEEFGETKPRRSFRGQSHGGRHETVDRATKALSDYKNGDRDAALAWARQFTIVFLSDIRSSICSCRSGATGHRAKDATARGAATAIASWLLTAFAITNPFSVALATFVIVVISSAAISSFCTTTDQEVLERLRRPTV
jgi:hypothetical protein